MAANSPTDIAGPAIGGRARGKGATRSANDLASSGKVEGQRRASKELNAAAHGLRGLASLMVLVAHILGGTSEHIYSDHAGYVAWVQAPWFLGTFGVQLFFVISGYVILPSAMKYPPREFGLRRFLRLYPLFFTLSVLFVILNGVTNAYPALNDPQAVVAGLLFLNLLTGSEQLTPNAWSLTFEVMFYILVCMNVHFLLRRRSAAGLLLGTCAALAFFIAYPITIYFVAGIIVRILKDRRPGSIRHARLIEAGLVMLTLLLASRGHYEYAWSDFSNPVIVPLILTTGTYFYFAVGANSLTSRILDNRAMIYVGTISYSLYLVHPYPYFLLRNLFLKSGWFTTDVLGSMLIFGMAVITLSLALAHAAHLALERWPYERFFRQPIYGGAHPAGTGSEPAAAPMERTS